MRVPERLSRIIAAIEALVLMVPATFAVLYLMAFLGMITSALREPIRDLLMLFNLFLLTSALLAGWRLLYVFVRGGAARLRHEGSWLWVLTSLGAALVLVGNAVDRLDVEAAKGLSSAFAVFGARLVVLLPLAHLLLERLMRTNNGSEPPAPGDA